jgi:hypothetical protein
VRELVPLVVEQDAAKMQHTFGSVSTPAHAGSVKPDSDEIADGTFNDTGSDGQVVTA